MKTYYLDPDYRIEPDISKPYCIRCQKPIKGDKNAVRVSYVNDWNVKLDPNGEYWIGRYCWANIIKE